MGINLASYVGATQVRRMVLGDDNRRADARRARAMKALVRDAMHDGAVGLSTSLQYAPAPYATTEELIALAAEAGKFGGIYATHMRSEGDAIVAGAIDEAIRIGREAHIPVEIWHLKAAGKQQLGAHAARSSPRSKRRARTASTSARTPTPIPPGSTPSPPSFRPGRTTAATRS